MAVGPVDFKALALREQHADLFRGDGDAGKRTVSFGLAHGTILVDNANAFVAHGFILQGAGGGSLNASGLSFQAWNPYQLSRWSTDLRTVRDSYFTRFATSSSVAKSPTLRVSLSSSPEILPV